MANPQNDDIDDDGQGPGLLLAEGIGDQAHQEHGPQYLLAGHQGQHQKRARLLGQVGRPGPGPGAGGSGISMLSQLWGFSS